MNTLRILLIDNSHIISNLLHTQLLKSNSVRPAIEVLGAREAEKKSALDGREVDVVLFGEKLPKATVARLAKSFRSYGLQAPMVILTHQSEARVSSSLQKAGVDDTLNIAELNTPVFGWTFLSTLKQVDMRKKAAEFDRLQSRLLQVNEALSHITDNMTTPLGALRSVVHDAGNGALSSKRKKDSLLQQLAENLNKVNHELQELIEIRRRLGETTLVINRALAERTREAE